MPTQGLLPRSRTKLYGLISYADSTTFSSTTGCGWPVKRPSQNVFFKSDLQPQLPKPCPWPTASLAMGIFRSWQRQEASLQLGPCRRNAFVKRL